MPKLSEASRKAVAWVALGTAALGLVLNLVFALFRYWDLTCLWGSLMGYAVGVGNFLLICLTVEKAVARDEKGARNLIRLSQQGRLLLHAGVLALAFTVKCFNPWAVMIMLLIPQIPIRLYPLTHREQKNDAAGGETLE